MKQLTQTEQKGRTIIFSISEDDTFIIKTVHHIENKYTQDYIYLLKEWQP